VFENQIENDQGFGAAFRPYIDLYLLSCRELPLTNWPLTTDLYKQMKKWYNMDR